MEKHSPEPLISVIVPAYNQARYLPVALDSVLAQTYANWECIIVNDGSPDNTEEIALKYAADDNRFKYLEKQNGGLSSARNAGLQAANGDWVQFLDSDDYIAPEKFRLSVDLINSGSDIDVVVSSFRMFTHTPGNSAGPFCELNQDKLTFEHILFDWDCYLNIPIHCGLFKASNFNKNAFNEALKAKEDWIMWLGLFQKKINAVYLDAELAYYRNNDTSMTKDKIFLYNNRIAAYQYIIRQLPQEYKDRFMFHVLEMLRSELVNYENDVRHYKRTLLQRVKNKLYKALKK